MMPAADTVPIGPEQAELMRRPVSMHVASRDAAHRPHLVRAIGLRLADDRRRITVFLHAASARDVLDDVRANGQLALVCSEPPTNRTLQVKGGDARVEPLADGDAAHVRDYVAGFAAVIGRLGFGADVAQTMFGHRADDLVAVAFTPAAAFEQTPGPKAGEAFGASAGAAPGSVRDA